MGRMNTVKENKRQTTYVHVWGESEKALQSKDDKASAIVDYGWKVCRNPPFQFYVSALHEKAGVGIKQNKCILKIPLCLWLFLFFKILLNYNSHNIKFTC